MKTKFRKNHIIYVLMLSLLTSAFLCGCKDSGSENESDGKVLKAENGEVNISIGMNSESDNSESDTSENEEPLKIQINNEENPVITLDDIENSEEDIQEPEEEEPEEDIYDPVNKLYSIHPQSKDEVTLAFVGDVGFAEGYATINRYRSMGSDIHNNIQEPVLDIMLGADIMMANNEFPYSYRGSPTPGKTYTFRADPKDVSIMKDMGVDIVSLANNHAYDYGPDALIDTVDTLNDAMLPFVGAGKNLEEAMRPAYFRANGKVIAYVSATQIERLGNPDTREATADSPGVLRTLDPTKAVQVIEEAAANSDFVVMYVHWGSESTDLVEQSQRDLAKAYVDAGCDLIIGDHSHCLQGIDYVDSVPVFYSLGNYWFNSKTLDTCIVRVTLDCDAKISKTEFIPCIQTGSCVKIGDGDNYDRILEYMRGISNYAEISPDGVVTESSENHNRQNGQNTSPAKKAPTPSPEEVLMQQLQEQQAAAAADASAEAVVEQ